MPVLFRFIHQVAIKVLHNAVVGVSDFTEKKCYQGVWFNIISVTRGWVGGWVSNIQGKKRYVILECPPPQVVL